MVAKVSSSRMVVALVAMVVGCCVRWFALWTWAELLVNITTWLCLTAVTVDVVVGADWGGNPSGTTFRISQSLFCNSNALGLFSND